MSISPILMEGYVRGLRYYEDEMAKGNLLPVKDFAQRLGKDVHFVQEQHQSGALYARSFSSAAIDEICAAHPEIKPSIPLTLAFQQAGKLLFYPSWQCRVPEPSDQIELPIVCAAPAIRPEIHMARTAYAIFRRELAADDKRGGMNIPPVSDSALSGFFDSTGGLSNRALSDYIVSRDKKPSRPLTIKQLTDAWWYHENPYGGFS